MRQIDESHFVPHFVGKLNDSYQHLKKKKLKALLKGMSVLCNHLLLDFVYSMNSSIQ